MCSVYKLTNFTVALFTWISLVPSGVPNVRIRDLVATRNLLKNVYKNKCHKDEIDTIFNSSCLFTSNALIQFEYAMLVCKVYFNTGVSFYISYITISSFAILREKRLGKNPNKPNSLRGQEEDMLWECDQLGDKTLNSIIPTLSWQLTQLTQLHSMKVEDFFFLKRWNWSIVHSLDRRKNK